MFGAVMESSLASLNLTLAFLRCCVTSCHAAGLWAVTAWKVPALLLTRGPGTLYGQF